MAIIYEKTTGSLIATPGRTVATFPSGLVRVDQTYVCATANAAGHRATLAVGNNMPDGNTAPAIDGLKIFPQPQETERGDGFTEFIVSAYGRTTTEIINLELIKKNIIPGFNQSFSSSVSFWEIKGKIAIPYGTNFEYDDLNLDPSLLLPFDAVYYGSDKTVLSVVVGEPFRTYLTKQDGTFGVVILRQYTITFTIDGVTPTDSWDVSIEDPIFSIVSQQNFGSFVEIDVLTSRSTTNRLTTNIND